MPLQFVQDNTGFTTAVIIPIDEWKYITDKHQDLKQLEQMPTAKAVEKMKPSDLAGTLSQEGYEALSAYTKQVRNEWDRNTF